MATTLHHWNPEDTDFWNAAGRRIARRNLGLSIPVLMLSCAVWMIWSVLVVHLPAAGFPYTTNQLFWLAALPALSGATLRLFYAFAVPWLGGRRFTALSTASLLLPAVGIGFAVQDPSTPFEWMVALALLCGLGGANGASAMANIGSFFPEARRSRAIDLNLGLGNLGIAIVQVAVPVAIGAAALGTSADATTAAPRWLQHAGFVWVPFIAVCVAASWRGMHDLADARSEFAEQAVIFLRRRTWLMGCLHLGTFGSFLGWSASAPLLLQSLAPQSGAARIAWLGPLAGALLRPVGGRLADRFGGGRVALGTFVTLATASGVALLAMPGAGPRTAAVVGTDLPLFLAALGVVFAAAGLGNGATFRMIPAVFLRDRQGQAGALAAARASALHAARVEGTAALGLASAIGAYGGFVLPKAFGTALSWSGSAVPALQALLAFYVACGALVWWHCVRRDASLRC